PLVSFSGLRLGLSVQDTWRAAPDLRVVAGLRYDVETVPGDRLRPDVTWGAYTGLNSAAAPRRVGALSPRIGLTWDVGGQGAWVVRASAGSYSLPVPSWALAEAMVMDGTPTVRRFVGDMGGWPDVPALDD